MVLAAGTADQGAGADSPAQGGVGSFTLAASGVPANATDANANVPSAAVTVVKGGASTEAEPSVAGTVRRPAIPAGWQLAAIAPSLAVFRSFDEIPGDLRISKVWTPPKDGRAEAPPYVESKSIREWLRALGPEFSDLQRNMLVLVAKEKAQGYVRVLGARLTNGVLAVEYADEAAESKADLNPVGGADLVLCARHDGPVVFSANGRPVCRPIPLALQKVTGGIHTTVGRSYPETRTNGVTITRLAWTLDGQQTRSAVNDGVGYYAAETIWKVPLGLAPGIKSDPPERVVQGPMYGIAKLRSADGLQRWEVDVRSGTPISAGPVEGAGRERALDELRGRIRAELDRAQTDHPFSVRNDTLPRVERLAAGLPKAESDAIASEMAGIRVRLAPRLVENRLAAARETYKEGNRARARECLRDARELLPKVRETGQGARADELTVEIEKAEKEMK
jgi:hypothetical protein